MPESASPTTWQLALAKPQCRLGRAAQAAPRPFGLVRLVGLSLCQIASWGTTYYAFTILLAEMHRDLGWSQESLALPFSLALLVSGLSSPLIGELVQVHGSRLVAVTGSLTISLCFVVWAGTSSYALYATLWLVIGLVMEATFFQPLFAAITRSDQQAPDRAIATATLLTSFSGSVFVALAAGLVAEIGWRGLLLAAAALQAVTALAQAMLLPRPDRKLTGAHEKGTSVSDDLSLRQLARMSRFWLLCASFASTNFIATALAVHLLPVLADKGLMTSQAIRVIAVMGVLQFATRLVLISCKSLPAAGLLAPFALAFEAVALGLLACGHGLSATFVFGALFGVSSGLMPIAVSSSIRQLFGPSVYGRAQGAVMGPAILARSAGPVCIAAMVANGVAYEMQLLICSCLSAASAATLGVMISRGLGRSPSAGGA